jgi:hypothetical protein
MRRYKPYRRPYKYFTILEKIEERNETQLEISQMLGITELSFRKKLDGKTEWKINEGLYLTVFLLLSTYNLL